MEIFVDFTFQRVALGSFLLGIICGAVGSFAVLRKQALLGDGISHGALPGVAAAFLLTGSRDGVNLLLGALASGAVSVFLIGRAVKKTRLKHDAALASVMSVMFGLGTVLLTYAQKLPNANQAGLERFIYGQASAISDSDLLLTAACCCGSLVVLLLFRKELKVFAFDPHYAAQLGFNCGFLNMILSLLTITAVIVGLQTVGAVLMSAMLVTPAVAARQWTDRLWVMVPLASAIGGFSGVAGTYVSSVCENVPTGPAIVAAVTVLAVFSLLFAPKRGIFGRLRRRKLHTAP